MHLKCSCGMSAFLSDVVFEHLHQAPQHGLPDLPCLCGCSGDLGLSTTSLGKTGICSSKLIAAPKVRHTNNPTSLTTWMSQTMRLETRFGSSQNPSLFISLHSLVRYGSRSAELCVAEQARQILTDSRTNEYNVGGKDWEYLRTDCCVANRGRRGQDQQL